MSIMQTFITIHDQTLIDECEADSRFDGLNHTYIFVGPRPVTVGGAPSSRYPRVIVSRDYTDNVEEWPHLYDFTGWWTLAHHKLIRADRVLFLQYDMRPAVPDLREQVLNALMHSPFAGFICGHRTANNWMLLLPNFAELFASGLSVRGASPPPPDFEEWPTTQGTAWRTSVFYEFMHWVRPILDVWANDQWAGHHAERSVYAWLRHTNRQWGLLPNVIHHDHGDCHGTCARMAGDIATADAKAATFGH